MVREKDGQFWPPVHPATEVALRNEGFDPHKVTDPLFMFNAATKAYEAFGVEQHRAIMAGKARL